MFTEIINLQNSAIVTLFVVGITYFSSNRKYKPNEKQIPSPFETIKKSVRTDAVYKPSSFSINTIPSLVGKTAVVTGGNKGIGYFTVKHLALNGAKVYMVSRSKDNATAAIKKIKLEAAALGKNVDIDFIQIDVSDMKQTKQAGIDLAAKLKSLDILICNAGAYLGYLDNAPNDFGNQVSVDGYEIMFATNYLGHFMLVQQLLPILLKTRNPRVITLSSSATWCAPMCGIDFTSVTEKLDGFLAGHYYSQSKLANSLFAVELNRRFGSQIIANAVHPGIVDTDLFQITPYSFMWFLTRIIPARMILGLVLGRFLTPEEGSYCSLYVATSKEIDERQIKGKYLIPFGVASDDHHPLALDPELAQKLWKFSDQLCQMY